MVRKRPFWAVLLILTFLSTASLLASDYKYVGSKNSLIYHHPTCYFAKLTKPGHLETFNSAREARKAGYLPCRLCKPPWKDKKAAGKGD